MIYETNNNIQPVEDIAKKMLALQGELSDEEAQATLAEFLFHNPAYLMDLVADIKMYPMQEFIIKGWMRNDYNLGVWGRGVSKSWTVALFALIWAIFNPNCRVVIISFAFRASRRILEQCEKFVNDEGAALLRACFPNDMNRKTDEWIWKLPNGSTIQSLPLGDGKKIRGIRADCLIIDEFAYLPETVIAEVVRPFLASNNKIREQLKNREREDALIAAGIMKEEERTKIDDRKKVVFLSSACYQFEHMYKRYTDWVDLLTSPLKKQELQDSGVSYFISRLSYEAAPDGLINTKEVNEARKETSEAMFDREYRAIFTSDSDGFFRASQMAKCSIPDGQQPCFELVGEPGAEYVLGIDVSLSGSESSDDFAMCLMKIVQRKDGKKIGMMVHGYAVAGATLKDHILYLFYLLKNFNIVYIAIDATQGDEVEFINSCNQSRLFQEHKISLLDIEADFKKDDISELPIQIKRSYNRTGGRIVQKQPFSSSFQRFANEYLQACFDHKGVLFAGKIAANDEASARAVLVDISLLQNHQEFENTSISQFIENQSNMLDLTRKECAMIQVKSTVLGTQSWDLPQTAKRTTGANRQRKDSYSALFLCNWAVKLYLESQTIEVQQGMPDFPYTIV